MPPMSSTVEKKGCVVHPSVSKNCKFFVEVAARQHRPLLRKLQMRVFKKATLRRKGSCLKAEGRSRLTTDVPRTQVLLKMESTLETK